VQRIDSGLAGVGGIREGNSKSDTKLRDGDTLLYWFLGYVQIST
jgi:hypothetical protein